MKSGSAGRRVRRVLLITTLLLVSVIAAGPWMITPWLRGRIVEAIEGSVTGHVAIDEFDFDWPAHLTATGVRVTDLAGTTVLEATALSGRVEVGSLFSGTTRVQLELDGVTLQLWRNAAGEWAPGTLQRIEAPPPPPRQAEEGAEEGEETEEEPEESPDLVLSVELLGSSVTLHGTKDEDAVIGIDLEMEIDVAPMDCTVARLEIESKPISGTFSGTVRNLRTWIDEPDSPPVGSKVSFEGLAGAFYYHPAAMSRIVGPWLRQTLSGDAERKIAFVIEGSLERPEFASLLEADLISADLELGSFLTMGLACEGALRLEVGEGQLSWQASLTANGGALEIAGRVEGHGVDFNTTLRVMAEDVGANARLSPFLSALHPAFAGVGALQHSEIGGRIHTEVELAYDGPLDEDLLAEGWEGFPHERIGGRGRFEIRDLDIQGTPAMVELLSILGVDSSRPTSLRPVEFTIDGGRLTYTRPWAWTIDGIETTFAGSVGLDRTLDLNWNLPVTDGLIARHSFLDFLRGEVIRVPIEGTASRPRILWRETLASLAADTARDGIFTSLGIGDSGDDPATLLVQADRLWGAGDREAAAVLYRRIRAEHRLSLVYALNRNRIKERGK